MTILTLVLALASVVVHCFAIFWPRKPLHTKLDANGMPVLWCNDDDKTQNIACVWREVTEVAITPVDENSSQRHSA